MSTGKKNIKKVKTTPVQAGRFAQLASMGEVVFHAKDLANLWKITSPNTLHTTLARYHAQGLLRRVYRGLYTLTPIGALDPLLLGSKALHTYSYVSTETILARAGIRMQTLPVITFVSGTSRTFSIGSQHYRSRKLADRFLHQEIGITTEHGITVASVERAVADLLYFHPRAFFDAPARIDWTRVRALQKAIGYPLHPHTL